MIVWAKAIERADMKLRSGDIAEALAYFKKEDEEERDAKFITLNPKNEHLTSEVADNIKVDYLEGCLTWEIWLSVDGGFTTTPQTTKFDIRKDMESPRFCEACLTGKQHNQMSHKDIRYCTECQQVIEYEYSLQSDRVHHKRYRPVLPEANSNAVESPNVDIGMGKQKEVLVHTNQENAKAYQNYTQTLTINMGGRPRKNVPVDLINKLSKQGLSIRQLLAELKEYKLSPMTISRVLAGERKD
jgi:hypothetical protein